MVVKNKKSGGILEMKEGAKCETCYQCSRKVCLLMILVLVSIISGALWLYYFKREISMDSFYGSCDNVEQKTMAKRNANIGESNVRSMTKQVLNGDSSSVKQSLNKYNITSLAYKIKKQIDKSQDYETNLNNLKNLLTDSEMKELAILEENKDKILTSDQKIIATLSDHLETLNKQEKEADKEDKTIMSKVKDSMENIFKVKKVEDAITNKALRTNISMAITRIVENNYKEASKYLEYTPKRPGFLEEPAAVLKAKAEAKSAIEKIIESTLNND